MEKNIGPIDTQGEIEPILIVDKSGKSVNKEYGKYVYSCASCFKIPRILTEDRGAALEGVAATVYPQLILAAHERQELYPQGYPLFGSWHSVPTRAQEEYLGIFNGFLMVVRDILRGGNFETSRKEFLQRLLRSRVLVRNEMINGKDLNPYYSINRVEETSAHVVQIYYSQNTVDDIIRAIAKNLGTL